MTLVTRAAGGGGGALSLLKDVTSIQLCETKLDQIGGYSVAFPCWPNRHHGARMKYKQ